MRALVLIGGILVMSGCATPLARMDPLGASGQDIQYRNGVPIVLSRSARFDVFASPVAGASGSHSVAGAIPMVIGIRNRSGQRIDVSEATLSASAGGRAAQVMSAPVAEETLRPDAAVIEGVNAVAAAMQDLETTTAFGPPEQPPDARSRIRTATLFQRNTIDAGAGYVAAIAIERDVRQAGEQPCRIAVFLLLDGEVHTFDFSEVPQQRYAVRDGQ